MTSIDDIDISTDALQNITKDWCSGMPRVDMISKYNLSDYYYRKMNQTLKSKGYKRQKFIKKTGKLMNLLQHYPDNIKSISNETTVTNTDASKEILPVETNLETTEISKIEEVFSSGSSEYESENEPEDPEILRSKMEKYEKIQAQVEAMKKLKNLNKELDKLTKKQITELLDQKSVRYKRSYNKEDLVNLCLDNGIEG